MDDLAQDTFVAFYSETGNPQVFQFATSQVKDKLVQAITCQTMFLCVCFIVLFVFVVH